MTSSDGLHPEAYALLEKFRALGARPLRELGVAGARKAVRGSRVLQGPVEEVFLVEDRSVAVPWGAVPVRVYRPSREDGLPVVVYLHGGGWVTGGLDEADGPCRVLANACRSVVVSVGYRLAPEVPYPGAVDDVEGVVRWLTADPGAVGGVSPLVLVGESAGGTLAIEGALRMRDSPGALGGLVTFYAPVGWPADIAPDERDISTLYAADMRWFWEQYAGEVPPGSAVPLSEEDLSGLPPTVVVTAGADVLAAEGGRLVERLESDGVVVEHVEAPGMVHGFLGMLGALPSARSVVDAVASQVRAYAGRD